MTADGAIVILTGMAIAFAAIGAGPAALFLAVAALLVLANDRLLGGRTRADSKRRNR